jgi:SAM-dependent methyltransferase
MRRPTYKERVISQIEQYADTVNMHDLPDIFHYWSHNYIRPGFSEVFDAASIDDAYAVAFEEARARTAGPGRILSIGCGDGGVEIRVAKILLERGVSNFVFVCADLSPILLDHLRDAVEAEGLASHFQLVEADLNHIDIPGTFDVIMANHSLHHIVGLEALFAFSHERLKDGGIFATSDIIGRNGHTRWPETAAILQAAWPMLKPMQRYNVQLRQHNETFVDHDCSTEGFEGIRAQDILPIMTKLFFPYKFFATAGIVDMFIERSYGHGFNVNSEQDITFVKFIADLNEILIDAGVVKPTWMMAYFTKDDRGEVFYRDRRAGNVVRNPLEDPRWTRFYQSPNPVE